MGTAACMGKLSISTERMGRRCELVMETPADGKCWYGSGAGMSSSSLDELLGSCPSVPLVSWQGGDREAEAQKILVSHRGGYK